MPGNNGNGHGDPKGIDAFGDLARWERVSDTLQDFMDGAPSASGVIQQHYHLPRTQAATLVAGELRTLDTHALLTTSPPPVKWLADGIYAAGKLTLFGGREKGGKSLVQMLLATTMASGGGQVAGITVAPGRVLLVDAENGESELHRRLRATRLPATIR